MYELIYSSKVKQGLNEKDISAILESSRHYNQKNSITGCLLLYNNQFVQILEGEKKEVIALYAKITQDSRHNDIILWAENDKSKRVFKDWRMAFHNFNDEPIKNIEDFIALTNAIVIADLTAKPTKSVKLFLDKVTQLFVDK